MLEYEPNLHKNILFACLDYDLHLERIAGGNESEVYLTDEGHFVVKLKNNPHSSLATALTEAKKLRSAAQEFCHIIGSEHSIPTHFLIAGGDTHHAYIVIVQPYLKESPSLFHLDYATMSPELRQQIALQLQTLIHRSIRSYWRTGVIPDIYGRSAASPEERIRRNSLPQMPARLYSFLIRRPLLRAHNLLLTPEQKIRLIDYDPVNESGLYKRIYYAARYLLFFRDLFLIWLMKHTGWVYLGGE